MKRDEHFSWTGEGGFDVAASIARLVCGGLMMSIIFIPPIS